MPRAILYLSDMEANKIELSSSVTVALYRELEANNDRQALAQFIRERFSERYFRPIESTPVAYKHGFMIMAVCCLVIETLESFYQGMADTRHNSARMFQGFFARDTVFKVFSGGDNWFYKDIRCGILHQSEARAGWRILRRGALLDMSAKSINATKFIRELVKVVDIYAEQLQCDDDLWRKFKDKMHAVCANCADAAH